MTTFDKIDFSIAQERQFGIIRKKVTNLIEILLEDIQNRGQKVHGQLCAEMCELGSYVKGVYLKFPSDPVSDNSAALNEEVERVDAKIKHILEF